MGFFSTKRNPAFDALVEVEREKARQDIFAKAAVEDARKDARRELADARFAVMSRPQRAKQRAKTGLQKAGSFLNTLSRGSKAISDKLSTVAGKFEEPPRTFANKSKVKSGGKRPLGGSLGDSLFNE